MALITRQRNGYILTTTLTELHRPAGGLGPVCIRPDIFGFIPALHGLLFLLTQTLPRRRDPSHRWGNTPHRITHDAGKSPPSNAPGIPGASGVTSPGSRSKKRNRPGQSRMRNSIRSSLTLCCAASLEHQYGGGRPCEPREYCKLASITEDLKVNTGRLYFQRITRCR